MRADEYVVEQYLELKKENEKLKKELEEALQEKEKVIVLEEEKSRNTEVVYLENKIYEIYLASCKSEYSIRCYIESNNNKYKEERIKGLKELLNSEDFSKFEQVQIDDSYYSDRFLVNIRSRHCQYKIRYMDKNCYILLDKYDGKVDINNYSEDEDYVFEDYEKAKIEIIKKVKKEISDVLKRYEVKNNDSEVKS